MLNYIKLGQENNMSYYYKYNFISPESLYAKIKEELRSYFNTGSIDDLLFPIWAEDCLEKLGRTSLKIQNTLLFLDNFEAKLPPDFKAVREAWGCGPVDHTEYQRPSYIYSTTSKLTDTHLPCEVDCTNPDTVQIVYKTSFNEVYTTNATYLLKPGNLQTRNSCSTDCLNFSSASADTFDIHGNKFVTNFREGEVFLVYYSKERTDAGHQLIPDNIRIRNYIESYIKYKIFEQLWHQVTDETYNQIAQKYQVYTQKKDEDFILAEIEIKKQTIEQKKASILRDRHRLDKYNID